MPNQSQLADMDEAINLFCRDIESGRAGRLVVEGDHMRLDLFSFSGRLEPARHRSYVAQLETGKYATLLECSGGWSERGYQFELTREDITPNFVLVGPRPWTSADRVRWIYFTFSGSEVAIQYGEHFRRQFKPSRRKAKRPTDVDRIDYNKLDILEVSVGGLKIRLRMSVTRAHRPTGSQTTAVPMVSIELDQPVPVQEIYAIAHQVLVFFEISLGQHTRMNGIVVSPLTEEQRLENMNARKLLDDFQLRIRLGPTPAGNWTHAGHLPFRFHNGKARRASRASLEKWIARRQTWATSYEMASNCLRKGNLYDRDRLLRAMAWFESIPLYQEPATISGSDVKKLAVAAALEAKKRSISVTSERLKQVLGELRRVPVPLKERLTTAVKHVRSKFDDFIVPETTEKACHAAADARNAAAHGGNSDGKRLDFSTNIDAVELVCFLSTLSGLNVDRELLDQHPLTMYRLASGV